MENLLLAPPTKSWIEPALETIASYDQEILKYNRSDDEGTSE